MATPSPAEEVSDDLARQIEAARHGSEDAVAWLLEHWRPYLLLVANDELDSGLRPKVGASDLVQESILEAHRDFGDFRGRTHEELLGWLRRVLRNNLTDARRRYLEAASRQVRQEELLDAANAAELRQKITAAAPGPDEQAEARERAEGLERVMGQLPEDYRRVLELRHQQDRSFREIGAALGRSEDAAKKLWHRAVRRLRQEMAGRR